MTGPGVLPSVCPLTVEDARQILAAQLLPLCQTHGPKRVGIAIGGADAGTVSSARDETSTLRLDYAVNLLMLEPKALDGFLAHVGRRSVPIDAHCNTDVMVGASAAVHAIAAARSPMSPGGADETDDEKLDQEPLIEAAVSALMARLSEIAEIKRARAARAAA